MKVSDNFINTVWNAVPLAERRAILADYITGAQPTRAEALPERAEPHLPVFVKVPKAKRSRKATKRAMKRPTADVQAAILAVVKPAKAYTSKDLAEATGIGQPAVDRAIKMLREAKKLRMGGEKRYSFYALNQAVADEASKRARSGKAPKKVNARLAANGVATA